VKAMLYHRPGGPEVLELTDVPDPDPGTKDVVVKVAATSLNRLDVVQRNGWYALPGLTFPHIAGMDVAGEIVAVGSDVHGLSVGERVVVDPSLGGVPEGSRYAGMGDFYGNLGVIGGTVAGGYAELCLVPSTHVHRVPAHIPLEHAATFPTAGLTAWHALFDTGKLLAGETILIHAAGAGVSVAAIQFAKHAGATVLATAGSDAKCEQAHAIGADHTANNRTDDIAAWARSVTDGRGVDMVFDHVGPALFEASLMSLRPRGRFVTCGNTTGDQLTVPSIGYLYHFGLQILGSDAYRPHEFAQAWDAFCAGGFDVVIDSEWPLVEAAAAQQKMLESDFFGKILLRP
jgi:NADPH:quinone reductase-like Zn-dependent oxidoreductase